MHLFKMKPDLSGQDGMTEFLRDNFVAIGYPDIGDLEYVSKDELKDRLTQVYRYEGQELANRLEELSTFVHVMQDGDYLIVEQEEWVHLGDLGDYYYIDQFDNADNVMCHRRGVTWLKSVMRLELTKELQQLLDEPGAIVRFKRPISKEQLEHWMSKPNEITLESGTSNLVDNQTIEQALEILREAMGSADSDRRERAAIAILQFAK